MQIICFIHKPISCKIKASVDIDYLVTVARVLMCWKQDKSLSDFN